MGYLILILWLLILPFCVGGLFQYHNGFQASLRLLKGQFLLWAVFQVVTVPVILREGTLETVMAVYLPLCFLLALAGLIFMVRRKERPRLSVLRENEGKETWILLAVVLVLWLVQMWMAVTQAVYDGDDSFYMAVANIANTNGSLYQINPYSIGYLELNYRYILAPFPVWVALLARISGLHTLTVGHVALGVDLISLSYLIYWQISKELFAKTVGRLRFMLCVCVLTLWGNTSIHTAETFLITRSRQGKALVSGLVFPAFVGLLLQIGNALDREEKISAQTWVGAACIMLTGCLGTAFGGAITILLWGGVNLLWLFSYRKPGLLLRAALSALPAAMFSLFYLMRF